ncbi:hypothetical protein CEE69_15010 [Rhodopirellula bahusiensis]|uniref:Uncharacterized protein n=1 Tax=Rhodopirellula bahusiensis TaxID=2014065 RepID=A0A2G1W677_9BACT|nr:hypothetical protein CEE69_15010 [Rhodopirellula bahusiensis]
MKEVHPCVSASEPLIDGDSRIIRLDSVPSWMRADFRQRQDYFVFSATGKQSKLGANLLVLSCNLRGQCRETWWPVQTLCSSL